jgi:hypothetical protein
MKRMLVLAVALALLLAGCTSASSKKAIPADPGPGMSSQQLVGTWVPVNATKIGSKSFAKFASDGKWTGQDGCSNLTGGDWSISQGNFHESEGVTTLIGCIHKPPANMPGLFLHASRLVLTGDDRMTVYGAHNRVIGQAARSFLPLG